MVKTFYPIQTSFSILDYFCQSTTFDDNSYTTEKLVYDKKNETVKYFNKQGKEFESNTLDYAFYYLKEKGFPETFTYITH